MKHTLLAGTIVAVTVLGAACNRSSSSTSSPAATSRSADASKRIPAPSMTDLHGAPPPSDETRGELYDVTRDIEALSSGDTGAQKDLADDLQGLARRMSQPPAPPSIDAVVASLAQASKGKTLSDEQRTKLTVLLYASVFSSELTESDRSAIAADLTATLKAVGAPDAPALATARAVGLLSGSPPTARR